MNNKDVSSGLHLLVGLDLSEMDRVLYDYILLMAEHFAISSVTCLHNVKVDELPEELRSADMLEKIQLRIYKKLSSDAAEFLPYSLHIVVTTHAFSEKAFQEQHASLKPDLILLGNKQQLEGSGGLPQKLVRVLNGYSLLVPDTFTKQLTRIVGSIDFSRQSDLVESLGKKMIQADRLGSLTFQPVHIVKMFTPFLSGTGGREVKKMFEEEAGAKQRKWAKRFPEGPDLQVKDAKDRNVASALMDYAELEQAAILMLGVQGATSFTGLFMGSVANELIRKPTRVALLFVK